VFVVVFVMSQDHSLAPPLDATVIEEILAYPGPFRDHEEEEECRRMVNELTLEEQEIAARVSYAYWLVSTTKEHNDCPSEELRIRSAMKAARRTFVGEGGNYKKALEQLRNSCKFRQVRAQQQQLPFTFIVMFCF
jgi:hypothetical protein